MSPRNLGIGAVIVILLIIVFTLSGGGESTATNQYYEVKRSDFLISVITGGNLEAVNEIVVRNEVDGTSRIVYLAPEGSFVQKGDLLVELDASEAEDQVNQQEIAVRTAELDLIQARQELEIQTSQAASDEAAARLKLTLAELDLKRFNEKEREQTLKELELEREKIIEQLAVEQETLEWSKKLFEQGFETKSTLDRNQLTVASLEKNKQIAEDAIYMWQNYNAKKQQTEYEEAVEEAKRELARVQAQNTSRLAQYEADVTTKEATVALQKSKLDRDRKNFEKTKLYAPAPGLVVYPVSRNRFSSESMIEEGATVRSRQELIKLPDTSKMKLVTKIHETQVGKVKPGMPTYVLLQSLPDQRFNAYVGKVALLPDAESRFGDPNLKVYSTEVIITDPLPSSVKPGVTAKAEIVITNIVGALKVPVQSVTTLKGKSVVYVEGNPPVPVEVKVGMFNTKFIEITSGLKDGDRVLLSPPLDSTPVDLEGGILKSEDELPSTNAIPANVQTAVPQQQSQGQRGSGNGERGEGRGGFGGGEGPGGGGRGFGGGGFTPPKEILDQYDKDGDGELNEEERNAMREAFRSRMREGGFGGGDGQGRPRGEGRGE